MTLRGALAYRLAMPLILSAVPGDVIEGQATLSVAIGSQFSDDIDKRYGSVRGRFELAIQQPVMRRLLVRGGIAGSLLGPPPCPPPPESKGAWTQAMPIGRSLEGHLEVGLSLPLGSVFSLEPYAGFGGRYLTKGETKDLLPGAFALSSSVRPLVTGGATVAATLTERVRGFTQVRFSRHFTGTQTLNPLDGASIERTMPDLDTASLTAGFAFRL